MPVAQGGQHADRQLLELHQHLLRARGPDSASTAACGNGGAAAQHSPNEVARRMHTATAMEYLLGVLRCLASYQKLLADTTHNMFQLQQDLTQNARHAVLLHLAATAAAQSTAARAKTAAKGLAKGPAKATAGTRAITDEEAIMRLAMTVLRIFSTVPQNSCKRQPPSTEASDPHPPACRQGPSTKAGRGRCFTGPPALGCSPGGKQQKESAHCSVHVFAVDSVAPVVAVAVDSRPAYLHVAILFDGALGKGKHRNRGTHTRRVVAKARPKTSRGGQAAERTPTASRLQICVARPSTCPYAGVRVGEAKLPGPPLQRARALDALAHVGLAQPGWHPASGTDDAAFHDCAEEAVGGMTPPSNVDTDEDGPARCWRDPAACGCADTYRSADSRFSPCRAGVPQLLALCAPLVARSSPFGVGGGRRVA